MFEVTGKYGTAKVYAAAVEDECISQIYGVMSSPVVEGCNIASMPDTQVGKDIVIGFTQKLNIENPRVNPNMVGCDVGCGMLVLKISAEAGNKLFNKPGFEKFDKIMHTEIPSGMNHRTTLHKFAKDFSRIRELIASTDYDKERCAL